MIAAAIERLPAPLAELLTESRYAARHCNRGLAAQLADLVRLRLSAGRIGISDYYQYRLYDARACDLKARARFAGWRMVRSLDRQLNQQSWLGLINDKLTTYLILEALDLPFPSLTAVLGVARPFTPRTPVVLDGAHLRSVLRDASLPLFAKPVQGSFGRGAMRIDSLQTGSERVVLHDGRTLGVDELLDLARAGGGYLLQQVVRQHPLLDRVCGGRLGTIRASVLLEPDGPWLCHATWKVTVGDNLTDNIDYGQTGNLVAWVCTESGRVRQVVGGTGRRLRFHQHHPDTGAPLLDLQLPHWPALRELIERGARALPRLRFQHWDVALGEDGPQVLEVNNNGDLYLAQQAERRGYLQPRLMRALRPAG